MLRCGLACTVLLLSSLSVSAAQKSPPPNIVFFLADDLGWGDVGFHGSKNHTPNLDRLAKYGVELRQQYVNPMCSPTRAAILSGRYASRFGVTGAQNNRAYPFGTTTVATALASVGYDTALVGKWHLGSDPNWGPQKFGFHHSYGSLAGGCEPYTHAYKTGPYSHTWHRNGKLIKEEGHITDLLTNEAITWLQGRKDKAKPFFLYVPFTAVHIPIDEPQKWLDLYSGIEPVSRRHYAACVSHMDDAVGRILAEVEKQGATKNTLVVFLSDNGAYPNAKNDDRLYPGGAKYSPGPAGGTNLPLRGKKTELYEGGIRIPAIASWPGKLKPGKCEQVIHAADWMPTLCALTGYAAKSDLKWDGISVWPMITAEKKPQARTAYWAGVGFRSAAIRDGDWKLIMTNANKKDAAKVELFDLGKDPNETTNLAKQYPDEVTRLRKKLTAVAARDNDAKVIEAKKK